MNREFDCSDKDTLVAYVYGECEASERLQVDAHLAGCQSCAAEVAGLGGVRQALAEWTPPAVAGSFRIVREEEQTAAPATVLRPARWWQRPAPAWARAAAAVLLLSAGAGMANLDVRYGSDGLSVRTGWRHAAPPPSPAAQASVAPASPATPWHADLAALGQQLRGEFGTGLQSVRVAAQPAARAAGLDERQVMARVRALIDESEQRQQRELAYRVAQVQGEIGVQRRADLLRVQQGFGQLQGQTGAEVAQQRQLLNYLLTVSQKK